MAEVLAAYVDDRYINILAFTDIWNSHYICIDLKHIVNHYKSLHFRFIAIHGDSSDEEYSSSLDSFDWTGEA